MQMVYLYVHKNDRIHIIIFLKKGMFCNINFL